MKKLIFVLLALIILFILKINLPLSKNTPSIIINKKTFSVDIAKTDSEKEKGLAVYNNLPLNKGMIFIFKNADYHAFWMKDMKFPIDIIYINKNKIVDVFKNVPAPKRKDERLPIIKPREKSDTILEINSGLSDKYNFKIGDFVKTNY